MAETKVITGTSSKNGIKNTALRAEVVISFEGVDISDKIDKYLISLSYTDNEEDKTDDLQIKLQDKDGLWLRKWLNDTVQAAASMKMSKSTKTKGLSIDAAIKQYDSTGNVKELKLGKFELDSIKGSGPPSIITIKGTSLPYGDGVRTEKRDKAWEGYTLKKIGNEIAQKAGLGFFYDCPNDPFFSRIEQAKQTDIAFLQTLCHNAGFSLKVINKRLVIFSQARYESLEESTTISWGDGTYSNYDYSTNKGTVDYAQCKVTYYHPGQKKTISATVNADDYDPEEDDNQVLSITDQRVESTKDAENLAYQMLRLHNKYENGMSFTMPGNPMLAAGLTVKVSDFGMWSGKYMTKQCRHEVSASGYTTKLTLRTIPKA